MGDEVSYWSNEDWPAEEPYEEDWWDYEDYEPGYDPLFDELEVAYTVNAP